jgi:hypothetical protein
MAYPDAIVCPGFELALETVPRARCLYQQRHRLDPPRTGFYTVYASIELDDQSWATLSKTVDTPSG